jgi:uncharacterized protein
LSMEGPGSLTRPAIPSATTDAPAVAFPQAALSPPGSETAPAAGEALAPVPEATLEIAAPEQSAPVSARPEVPATPAARLSTVAPTTPSEPRQDAPAADAEPLPTPPTAPEDREASVAPTPEGTGAPEPPAPEPAATDELQPPPSVLVDRLPRIGTDPSPQAGASDQPVTPPVATLPGAPNRIMPSQPPPAPAAPEATPSDEMTALVANAVAFDNPGNRPVLAIVLTDTADRAGPGPEALAAFPFPLTVALDPSAAGASDTMRTYRDAGVEVAMFVRFPEDATAQDVAVAWGVHTTTLPEAVALVDASDGAIQSMREPMAQVVAELVRSGHGFLTSSQGFNAGQKLAEREGVPSGLVFRQLDPSDRGAMTRALDQGAFRAGQEGRAILTAPLSDATLAVLAEWGLGTRQASVVLAPLSAALD